MSRARDKANSTVSNFASTGIDDNADANAITIDSSENVGIGTTSPNELLHLNANNPEFTMQAATDGGECAIYFKDDDGNKDGRITYRTDYSGQTDNFMSFFTNSAEKMRIDGSGNLLVGTTTNGTTADGTVIRASAETLMTRSNGAPLLVNRRGSDGAAIEVRNDNAVVGYINANASGMGVYLGGTAAANHLDSYEEGTFTATSSVGTISSGFGSYTKVGDLVTVQVVVSNFSDRTNTSGIGIGGLPFTSSSNNVSTQGILAQYVNTGGDAVVAYLGVNSSTISFYTTNQNSGYGLVGYNDLSSTAAEFYIQLSYKT